MTSVSNMLVEGYDKDESIEVTISFYNSPPRDDRSPSAKHVDDYSLHLSVPDSLQGD